MRPHFAFESHRVSWLFQLIFYPSVCVCQCIILHNLWRRTVQLPRHSWCLFNDRNILASTTALRTELIVNHVLISSLIAFQLVGWLTYVNVKGTCGYIDAGPFNVNRVEATLRWVIAAEHSAILWPTAFHLNTKCTYNNKTTSIGLHLNTTDVFFQWRF